MKEVKNITKQAKTDKTLVMILLCLFVVLISVSSASAASTVYVNATGGNDSNTGTIDHPYQTIGQGINSVDENGTVTIADGTYSGTGNTNLTITKNMNIIGESQSGTIINGQKSGNSIFTIASGVTVTITNLTLTNGTTTNVGGAIYNGGTLTITNSTLTNNTATSGGGVGGAIYNDNTLNITNSTFTGNTAWDGGAIYNDQGTLTITNSTLTGNTADTGGAISNYEGTLTVGNSTFTGNAATINGRALFGGAIYNVYSTDVFVSFCRIIDNGANEIYNDAGSVTAKYNWWGSNDNPSGYVSSGVDVSPWLVLTVTSDNSTILVGGNPTVTVDLQHDSNGVYLDPVTKGHVPDGTLITFNLSNSSLGSLNTTSTTLTNGTATTKFTSTNIGTENVTATVDNQLESTLIIINKLNTTLTVNNTTGINGQKVNLTATLTDQNGNPLTGQTVTFTVNGKNYTATTNNEGIATYEYTITQTAGVYPVSASFVNGTVYTNSTGTGNLTVNLINTTVTVNNTTVTDGKSVNLTATLKDENGNLLTGKTVTFTINGKDYTAVTDNNGVATLNYTPSKAGTYTVTANFVNDTIYANSTGNATLTVEPVTYLYLNTTTSNQNPKVGDTFILTYKLSNNGPDNATNVTISFQIPSGLEFVTASADNGTWTYNPTNRTITWNLTNVTVGDPYLYLTVKASGSGNYPITPIITSETFNQNTNPLTPFTVNVQTPNNNNSTENNTTGNNTTNTVHAATQTVAMQPTGMPIAGLVLAILAIFSGMLPRRKQ